MVNWLGLTNNRCAMWFFLEYGLSFGLSKIRFEHVVFADMSREIFPVEDRVIFQSCIDENLSCCPCFVLLSLFYSRLNVELALLPTKPLVF